MSTPAYVRKIKYQARDGSLHDTEERAQAVDDLRDKIGPDDPRYRYRFWSITDVCQGLHGEVTGGTELCMSRAEQEEAVAWLEWRLVHWQPSPLSSVDEAIRSLIVATLIEWHRWRNRMDALSSSNT